MAKLGSFGAAVREFDPDIERDDFEFFGETFVIEGVVPSMLMLQLGAALAGKIREMDGNGAIYEALRCALTKPERGDEPEDDAQWDRFYQLAVRKKAEMDDLLVLTLTIVGAQGGKAEERLPTSPPGSPPAGESSSSSASDSPDSPRLVPVDELLGGSPT